MFSACTSLALPSLCRTRLSLSDAASPAMALSLRYSTPLRIRALQGLQRRFNAPHSYPLPRPTQNTTRAKTKTQQALNTTNKSPPNDAPPLNSRRNHIPKRLSSKKESRSMREKQVGVGRRSGARIAQKSGRQKTFFEATRGREGRDAREGGQTNEGRRTNEERKEGT